MEIRIRLEAAKFPLVGDVRVADRSPALAVPFIGILGLLEVLQDQILGHGPDDGVTQQ